jgi:hypothetical protein
VKCTRGSDQSQPGQGTRSGELDELRSFSLFRLALVYAYEGDATLRQKASPNAGRLSRFALCRLAEAWLAAYQPGGDIARRAAVTSYAEANPKPSLRSPITAMLIQPSLRRALSCARHRDVRRRAHRHRTPETPEVAATEPISPLLT